MANHANVSVPTSAIPPRFNLDTVAMIVEFSASVWTARKLDKGVTEEVVKDKHAQARGAARVNKHLLAGRNELDQIQKFTANVRNWIYVNTLPWSDNGLRLLPVVKYMSFDQQMQQYANQFDTLVKAFVAVYPSLITAQAMALGDLFNRDEYPSASVIEGKFGFYYNYLPVPTAGDLRVDVGNDARAELQQKLEEIAAQRVEDAKKDLWQRLHTHLTRMVDRLKVDLVQGEEKPRRFHDTLVTGGEELCDLLEALNVTKDPDLQLAQINLRNILSGVEADDLRQDFVLRERTRSRIEDMLDKFSF